MGMKNKKVFVCFVVLLDIHTFEGLISAKEMCF